MSAISGAPIFTNITAASSRASSQRRSFMRSLSLLFFWFRNRWFPPPMPRSCRIDRTFAGPAFAPDRLFSVPRWRKHVAAERFQPGLSRIAQIWKAENIFQSLEQGVVVIRRFRNGLAFDERREHDRADAAAAGTEHARPLIRHVEHGR